MPVSNIRRRLLNWYDKHKRDLPWRRRQKDPYAQWVAEIMLQQTRVESVIRYYDRFLSRFPDVKALARAEHQDVLKMWEGLGYYRRILNLHRATGQIAESGGHVPKSAARLRELPGIGNYTAAAIASIAYGEPVAAVDANVARVVGRLLGLNEVSSSAARLRIQREADALLNKSRPGDFNQAWMDLGSSICLPREPKCEQCPLRACCAVGSGASDQTQMARPRPSPKESSIAVGILLHRNRLLVRQRPTGGLWSGLWEFPSIDLAPAGRRPKQSVPVADVLGEAMAEPAVKIGTVQHRLTHRLITFHVYEARVERAANVLDESSRWVTQEAFKQLPVSTAHRRIHDLWFASRGRRSKQVSRASPPGLPTYDSAPSR